jgi:hypothetical protein
MRSTRTLFGILLLVALFGCGDDPAESINSTGFQTLLTTPYSNMREPARIVVSDSLSWAQLWTTIIEGQSDPAKIPAVDFRKQQVVVAALGERKRAGYAIRIEQIEQSNGMRQVVVEETAPGTNCNSSEVITTPLDAVVVNKSTLPSMFVERLIVRPC